MRRSLLLSTTALAVAGMIAGFWAPAQADDGHAGMTGMNHGAASVAGRADDDPPQLLNEGVLRSRQRVSYFKATLNGNNEVPAADGKATGDKNARADVVVRIQGNRVSYFAKWKNMQAPTLFHIHQGDEGVNGDVKVNVLKTALPETVTAALGHAKIDNARIRDDIVANPGGFYSTCTPPSSPAAPSGPSSSRRSGPTWWRCWRCGARS